MAVILMTQKLKTINPPVMANMVNMYSRTVKGCRSPYPVCERVVATQ